MRAEKGARTGPSSAAIPATTTGEAEDEEETPPAPLGAPANLRASDTGDTHLRFEWDAVADATGYRYRIRTDSGSWGPWTSTAGGTRHTAEGLASGTTYWFKVRAEKGARTGPSSTAISATTTGEAEDAEDTTPTAPGNLRVVVGDGRLTFNWDAVTDATGYSYRMKAGEAEWGAWAAVAAAGTSHTAENLANGTTYWFQVRAAYGDEPGPASVETSGTPTKSGASPVTIPDAALRHCLKQRLGKGAVSVITEAELAKLSGLDCSRNRFPVGSVESQRSSDDAIANLAGLESAVNLRSLRLAGNRVANLDAVVGLRSLSWLDLGANGLSDISPLANMPALERLWLNDNAIGDISPLVANSGLGEGDVHADGSSDYVDLRGNALNNDAVAEHAPLLRDRGAAVLLDDGAHLLPVFAPAGDHWRQSFARIVNPSARDGEVSVTAIDVLGRRFGPTTLPVGANQAVHINSHDLEFGNVAKGLSQGVGLGDGDWRLELRSALPIDVFAYMRHADGVVTSMSALVPEADAQHRIAIFNPGSSGEQASSLRVINPAGREARVLVEGMDDRGVASSAALTVPAGGTRDFTAAALEDGTGVGVAGGLGDGAGNWRITATSFDGVLVVNMLDSPAGHRANLSVEPQDDEGDVQHLPLLPAATSFPTMESFVRVVNHSARTGTVRVQAVDADGRSQTAGTLALAAHGSMHFDSRELEEGNAGIGLTGVAFGQGDWRLELRSELKIGVYGYARAADGFLTSIHERAPVTETGAHRVVYFNPASNTRQASRLRVVNTAANAAEVHVTGVDDAGKAAAGAVRLTIPAHGTRELTAQDLETGQVDGVVGALGDGSGKWRLWVESDNKLLVMSLLEDDAGHLTNLSR